MPNGKNSGLRILVVDDEVDIAESLALHLASDGHVCDVALDGKAALVELERDRFDVVISDVRMRGMGGIELLGHIRRTDHPLPVILVSGYENTSSAIALEQGAMRFYAKPLDLDDLRLVLQTEIAPDSRPARDESPPERATEIEVVGPAMRRLLATHRRAARARSPILVRGETGSGKEIAARALHAMGPRREKPFVAVNVSAVPAQLLESELFGHVRGSFTGAMNARRGLLAEADGGTLLLDEIGDMPLDLQAKLLRVLGDGDVRAVGADKSRNVDVRFIAATHRDLPRLVRQGRFRHDLFFRLNVIPITVPPLRERPEDIGPLATHFLAASRKHVPDSPVSAIAPDAMALLLQARWPGNVRELESAMDRLVIGGHTETVSRDDVRAVLDRVEDDDASDAGEPSTASSAQLRSLDRVVREHVAIVMKSTNGNKTQAAKILGVNLSTLYRWRSKRGTA